MQKTYRMGALHVVENVLDVDWMNRLLRQIDPNLFCERQIDYAGDHVWCVVDDVPGDTGPVTVYEHRDVNGDPMPYPTQSMIDYFLKMRQDGLTPLERSQQALAENNAIKARIEEAQAEVYADIGKQIRKRVSGKTLVPLRKTGAAGSSRREAELRHGDVVREAILGGS